MKKKKQDYDCSAGIFYGSFGWVTVSPSLTPYLQFGILVLAILLLFMFERFSYIK